MLANFIAGTATSAGVLFLARLLDGITGGNNSVAQAVISDVTNRENRAKGFGIYGAAFGLGLVLGPAMSLLASAYFCRSFFFGFRFYCNACSLDYYLFFA